MFFSPVLREQPRMIHPPFRQPEPHCGPQAAKPVFHAPAEVYGRGIRHVARRAADLGYGIAVPEDLGEHLVVKHEIVGIGFQRQLKQELS